MLPRPGHKDAEPKEKKVCKKASEACKGIGGDGPDSWGKNNPQDGVKEKAVMGDLTRQLCILEKEAVWLGLQAWQERGQEELKELMPS